MYVKIIGGLLGLMLLLGGCSTSTSILTGVSDAGQNLEVVSSKYPDNPNVNLTFDPDKLEEI